MPTPERRHYRSAQNKPTSRGYIATTSPSRGTCTCWGFVPPAPCNQFSSRDDRFGLIGFPILTKIMEGNPSRRAGLAMRQSRQQPQRSRYS
jgi:hypothetical protein